VLFVVPQDLSFFLARIRSSCVFLCRPCFLLSRSWCSPTEISLSAWCPASGLLCETCSRAKVTILQCTSRFPQAETAFRAGFLFPLRDFLAQEGAPTGSPVDIYFFAQILIFAEPVFLPLKGQPSRSLAWSGDRLWALAVIARLPAAASFPCSRSTECTGRSPGFLLAFC
jgi:hypothetical protein